MENKPMPRWTQKLNKLLLWIFILVVGIPSVVKLGKMTYHWIKPTTVASGYIEELVPLTQKTSELLNNIAPVFTNANQYSPEEALKQVIKTKEEFSTLKNKAETIHPPSKWQETHKQFVLALSDYFEAFKLTEEGMQKNDSGKINMAADLMVKGAGEINQATVSIQAPPPNCAAGTHWSPTLKSCQPN